MQEQPICPECGGSLSDYYALYQKLRVEKIKKVLSEKDVDITVMDISQFEMNANEDDPALDMSDVFDKLGFKRICCRGHLTAAKDFYDYYRSAK